MSAGRDDRGLFMSNPFLVRLPKGDDLLEAMTRAFEERSVSSASFTLIGAVTDAVLGYYDFETRSYKNREFKGDFEIVSCMGNVSLKDGKIFVHAHISLAGKDYGCIGGHLMPGATIFAAELMATPVPGEAHVREMDEPTGLALWRRR